MDPIRVLLGAGKEAQTPLVMIVCFHQEVGGIRMTEFLLLHPFLNVSGEKEIWTLPNNSNRIPNKGKAFLGLSAFSHYLGAQPGPDNFT